MAQQKNPGLISTIWHLSAWTALRWLFGSVIKAIGYLLVCFTGTIALGLMIGFTIHVVIPSLPVLLILYPWIFIRIGRALIGKGNDE